VLTIIYFCFICVNYNKIRIAIKIMEASADFVTEVFHVMFLPPIFVVLVIIWAGVWTVAAVCIYA
jgi:hypothetical protein